MPPSTTGPAVLVASELSLVRGGRVLFEALSFDVKPGQLLQLAGANGAGKTSLLRILAGLSRYGYEGSVERHAPLMFLGHLAGVKAMLTPRENLGWHVSGEGGYSPARIDEALEQVGLYGYEDVPAHTLSAGQQRRINLARLFLSASPLWLLDEPFTAIDVQGVAALTERVDQHVADGGAVVLTSHQAVDSRHGVGTLSLDEGVS